MRLKFYILWFENEPEWINSRIDDIKDIVEDHGFEWVDPTICKKEEEFIGDYNDYDIILMDYSLVHGIRGGKTGADIINKIRLKGSFTNILFYSQHGELNLRKEIADKGLDGVFCLHRDDFLDSFEKIFKTNIKKIEDVNNLRGLVMAETSDLDNLKEEIIRIYDKANCEKKKTITKKILEKMVKFHNENKELLDSKNEETPFEELIDFFDLYKKGYVVHKINCKGTPIVDFELSKFLEEIIEKRNLLAHVKEKVIEDASGKKTILESEKNGKKLIFSHAEATKIRKDITRYRNELKKLKKTLENEL